MVPRPLRQIPGMRACGRTSAWTKVRPPCSAASTRHDQEDAMSISRRALLHTAGALALAGPTRAEEKVRITVWHAMSAALGEELNKLITAFNASQDSVEVTGLFKGAYKDLLTQV